MSADYVRLKELIWEELVNVPLAHWGFFFPCLVAIWKFIEEKNPDFLGKLDAGYDSEPYFLGIRGQWFCDTIANNTDIVDVLDPMMRDIAMHVPEAAIRRGHLHPVEMPVLETLLVQQLAGLVEQIVSAATLGNQDLG